MYWLYGNRMAKNPNYHQQLPYTIHTVTTIIFFFWFPLGWQSKRWSNTGKRQPSKAGQEVQGLAPEVLWNPRLSHVLLQECNRKHNIVCRSIPLATWICTSCVKVWVNMTCIGTTYYPMHMCRGKAISFVCHLSVSLSVCLSVCRHHKNRQIRRFRHLKWSVIVGSCVFFLLIHHANQLHLWLICSYMYTQLQLI